MNDTRSPSSSADRVRRYRQHRSEGKQAKNTEAERRACEIRLRAERKAGQLLSKMKKAKGRAGPGRGKAGRAAGPAFNDAKTLSEHGISKSQSSRGQALGNVPEEEFEAALGGEEKPTTSGIIAKPPQMPATSLVNAQSIGFDFASTNKGQTAMRRRLSKFPLHKPFEKQPSDSELQRVVLRLIVGFDTERAYVVGTATVICGHLLLTARHVIEEALRRETILESDPPTVENNLVALQVVPGPEYVLWHVLNMWLCPQTDLAFLQVASEPSTSAIKLKVQWTHPIIRAFPPNVGESVAAIGYRKSKIQVSKNDQGGLHHDLKEELITSVGVVREVFPTHRDRTQLPFPCYQVSNRFDAGMSGGPVFDETGALCGLVCSNIAGSHIDAEPISYVTTLWPMFLTKIAADRGDAYPRGVTYPVFELARDNIIGVVDYPELAAMQPTS